MICSSCGTENEAGRKFCKECAARLAVTCPSCGAANSADAKFCGECATALGGSAPLAMPGPGLHPEAAAGGEPAVAERRLVSILFADLVGFTALAEGRDAEDTRELLSRYFELAREVIGRYGGTVEKFIGDAVMAVWGAPSTHEDDAERAVRAALELVDAVRSLGPGISARAGVLTGEAAVTIGATNQGMVAGDLVNTASRLQSVAAPGTVLVGEATQRATSKAIAFEPAGEQALKGKSAAVPAWRALRVVAELGGRNRADVLEAPFVGRDEELRLIKDLFHATSREKRARLVSVIGPGGIGKTRLAWEFSKYSDGLVESVWFHDGRSPAYGDGISFWALGEMVRERCRLLEADDEATTRAKVAETVARHVPDAAERSWVEPALLALLGVESEMGSEQLFGAWRTFFERLAETSPVVMVFEDFHHADSGLVEFIDYLLEWSRNLPIYIVTLARPEFLERRPEWGAGKRSFTSLYLEPLTPDAMRELLAGLVPGLPRNAERAIIARADGIPLYAVETVRMLLAEGKLRLEDGVYRPTGELADLAVPETLTALIASRLDALPADDRALVSDAAVLGQSFTSGGLAAVSGQPEDELATGLRSLVRREILTVETDPRSPDRGQYAFVQGLIREVAYHALAKRDRKTRHLAAARYFESLGSDELAGALAGHYLAAHANAPGGDEADALATQARITLRAAAERATALAANGQATDFFEQALAVTNDPRERAELLERAAATASLAGQADKGKGFLAQVIALHESNGDRVGLCRATGELGRILLNASEPGPALALLSGAAEQFADLVDDPAGIALWTQLARAQFLFAHSADSIVTADATLARAERLDLVPLIADLLVTKGTALGVVGRPREGFGAVEAGRQLAETAGLTFTILRAALNSTGFTAESDPRTTLAAARRSLDLAERLGIQSFLLDFQELIGFLALRLGDWDGGLATVTNALDGAQPDEEVHLRGVQAFYTLLRGAPPAPVLAEIERQLEGETDPQAISHLPFAQSIAALAAGDRRLARAAADRVIEILPPKPDMLTTLIFARTCLWAADLAEAEEALGRLQEVAGRGPGVDAGRLAVMAGIAALNGRRDEARAGYRTSLRLSRELGIVMDEFLTVIDMATLLDPDDPDVRAAAGPARETLVRLGAQPFLARLDAALARSGPAAPAPADERVVLTESAAST